MANQKQQNPREQKQFGGGKPQRQQEQEQGKRQDERMPEHRKHQDEQQRSPGQQHPDMDRRDERR